MSEIARELPEGDPLGEQVRGMTGLLNEKMPAINELQKSGKVSDWDRELDALASELNKRFALAVELWDRSEPKPVFRRDRYDAECSYSPDGRFILYTHVREAPKPAADQPPGKDDGDLWLYDTRTGGQIPLITADGYDGGPFFSPDGTRICYRSDRKGDDKLQLFVADLKFEDGFPVGIVREHQLTSDDNVNWAPFWHPSGKFLIYASSAAGHANYEVFALPAPPLDSKDESDRARPARRITFAPGADILPAFSADGTWMMWTSQRGGVQPGEQRPTSQVWVARVKDAANWTAGNRPTPLGRVEATAKIRAALREKHGREDSSDERCRFQIVRVQGGWKGSGNMTCAPDAWETIFALDDGRVRLYNDRPAAGRDDPERLSLYKPPAEAER